MNAKEMLRRAEMAIEIATDLWLDQTWYGAEDNATTRLRVASWIADDYEHGGRLKEER